MNQFPQVLYVGPNNRIEPYEYEPWSEIEKDPRGLLLMFEPPMPGAKYVMGLDPTVGITGWSRATRTSGDEKTDNAAIEIFRVDGYVEPIYVEKGGTRVPDIDPVTNRPRMLLRDVQAAEYAAPCDAVEIARVAYILGRIYCGDADDQCRLIHEAWPGPGLLTTQELIRLGYGNLFMWQHLDTIVEETRAIGWHSSNQSQRLLWQRSRRHLMGRHAIIRSKFLLDEYANAEIDLEKMRARAAYGYHDDRFQAANMAFWAGHEWTMDLESEVMPVTQTPVIDYQTYAPTLEDPMSYREWREHACDGWEDD